MQKFFAKKENQLLYVQYYMELNEAIEDYHATLKIELNNYFSNPGKIISIKNSHLGFQAFARCIYRLLYERPNYFNVKCFADPTDEMYRVDILLELENFLVNLPGAKTPLRPTAIGAWLSLKQNGRYSKY